MIVVLIHALDNGLFKVGERPQRGLLIKTMS